MSRRFRTVRVFCFLLFLGVSTTCRSQEATAVLDTFGLAFSSKIFYEVDLKDAQVAIALWTAEISRQLEVPLVPSTSIFSNIEMIEKALRSKTVDMVAIPSLDYLRIRDDVDLEPAVVGVAAGRHDEELVILVRKDSAIASLEQLRGGCLLIPAGYASGSVALIWLETVLLKNGFGGIDAFFREVKRVSKPSKAVLPVFFGQAEAGLVSKRSFDVMTELNPQVGNELRILEHSPGFIRYLFCFRRDYKPETKRLILDEAMQLETYPKGRQVLTLFKLDRVAHFQDAYLNTVRALLGEYESVKRKRNAAVGR